MQRITITAALLAATVTRPQQLANATEDSSTLARYAWPYLGAFDVAVIDVPHVLVVLEQKVPASKGYPAGTFWTARAVEVAPRAPRRARAASARAAEASLPRGRQPAPVRRRAQRSAGRCCHERDAAPSRLQRDRARHSVGVLDLGARADRAQQPCHRDVRWRMPSAATSRRSTGAPTCSTSVAS